MYTIIHHPLVEKVLENYDVKRDRYVGEELFKKLSFTSKIVLGPLFFKALFK